MIKQSNFQNKRHAASSHFNKRKSNKTSAHLNQSMRGSEWAQDNMNQRPTYAKSHITRHVRSSNNRKGSQSVHEEEDRFYSRSKQNQYAYSTSAFNSRTGSTQSKRYIPNYVNEVGPGEYNVPRYSATMNISVSQNRNAPQFSLAPKTKQPYFPQFEVDFKGRDAPSMDTYNPSFKSTKQQTPSYTQSKTERFMQLKDKSTIQKNLPTQYHKLTMFDRKNGKGFSMSTGKKWTLHIEKRDDVNPGPIYQTQYLQSIDYQVQNTNEMAVSSFGTNRDKLHLVPMKGQEGVRYGRHSPGPMAHYSAGGDLRNTLSVTKNSQKFSIPKVSFSGQISPFISDCYFLLWNRKQDSKLQRSTILDQVNTRIQTRSQEK